MCKRQGGIVGLLAAIGLCVFIQYALGDQKFSVLNILPTKFCIERISEYGLVFNSSNNIKSNRPTLDFAPFAIGDERIYINRNVAFGWYNQSIRQFIFGMAGGLQRYRNLIRGFMINTNFINNSWCFSTINKLGGYFKPIFPMNIRINRSAAIQVAGTRYSRENISPFQSFGVALLSYDPNKLKKSYQSEPGSNDYQPKRIARQLHGVISNLAIGIKFSIAIAGVFLSYFFYGIAYCVFKRGCIYRICFSAFLFFAGIFVWFIDGLIVTGCV